MHRTIGGILIGVGAFGIAGFATDQIISNLESAPAIFQKLNPSIGDYLPCFQCFVSDGANAILQNDPENRIAVTDSQIAVFSFLLIAIGTLLFLFG
jgi:hypothetical protein